MKKCSNLECNNPLRNQEGLLLESEFYACIRYSDGLYCYCKYCTLKDQKQSRSVSCVAKRIKDYTKRYTYSQKGIIARRQSTWKRYGIKNPDGSQFKWDNYLNLLVFARDINGVIRCEACNTDKPGAHNWCVDHDHSTGVARGILCNSCNIKIGVYELVLASPQILEYLGE